MTKKCFFFVLFFCCYLCYAVIISPQALAREGDYKMHHVCMRACVRAIVCHYYLRYLYQILEVSDMY